MGLLQTQRPTEVFGTKFAPLNAGLFTKSGDCQKPARTQYPRQPCNLYIGPDFLVRVSDWLRMPRLIADDTAGGIMHSDFVLTGSLKELRFSKGAFRLLTLPNAGGNSVMSEALSFELMQRCFRATLSKTEMEVQYFPMGGSMTDYVVSLWGRQIAVSVTRAFKYQALFTEDDATHLLNKKLKGVVQSSRNALEKWSKQILHVWTTSAADAATLTSAYHDRVDPCLKANTVVLVTTATRSPFIFDNT